MKTLGFIGLGKLGILIATALSCRGFHVLGYDINPQNCNGNRRPFKELGPNGTDFNDVLDAAAMLTFAPNMKHVAEHSDTVFFCIQTPHEMMYDGSHIVPGERKDFDYTYLVSAIKEFAQYVTRPTVIAVISTVLPGTMEREVRPHLNEHMKLVYTPQTPAMGTGFLDFLDSEFYLLGVDDPWAADEMAMVYTMVNPRTPQRRMSIESAELAKVVYNTFITSKICYTQAVLEIAHKIPGVDVDDVMGVIKISDKRLLSPRYLTGGMHDAGGCHPRDLIAMSYLSEQLDLSYDLFGEMVNCREKQMMFLASLVATEHMEHGFTEPIIIMGTTFKKESNITTGSSALLCADILRMWGYEVITFDPHIDDRWPGYEPTAFLIGMNHDEFLEVGFPLGSVVIDPFRYIKDQEGVTVIRVGQGK